MEINKIDYSEYSKEELLDIVEGLQRVNQHLQNNAQPKQPSNLNHGKMSFRQTYAEKILDALPDMLTVITDDGLTVAIVSSEETNHSGIPRDNISGVPVRDFLPDYVYDHVMLSVEQAMKWGISENLNHLMYVEGKPHYFENRTVRIEDNCNLCLCRDITSEMLLKLQLESLSYAVNLVDEKIFSLNSAGEFQFVNNQFLNDHKQTKDIIGQSAIGIIFSCPTGESWEELKEGICQNDGKINYIIESLDLDGNKISYEVVGNSFRNINNDEEFWFFAKNITLRLKQEQEIKDLNELMNVILSNIPIYLFVKDTTDFRYLYWNKAIEKLMGVSTKQAIGHTDDEIFSDPQMARKLMANDSTLLQANRRVDYIENVTDVNGKERILKAIKVPLLRTGKEPLIIGVALDITDIKVVEKELIVAKLEAEKSNQLKSAFLANMSHEIRTPLNAIVGFARLILTEEDKEARQEYSDIVDRNAELLLQLINDILDLSKIEAGTLDFVIKEVNLDELCTDMYEVHRMRVPQEVSLIYDGMGDKVIIESDRNRLTQVFTNLLSNAIKFTSSGEIHFGYSINGNQIEAFVRDTGMGISAEKLPTIFDRFIKLNNFVPGTGLGLSIVKTIIEHLGGTISATSEEGHGTEFRFTIPYNNIVVELGSKSITTDTLKKQDIAFEPNSRKILIADDNDSNYLLLKSIIRGEYSYYHARNGKEAVKLFLQYSPNLIFMDIKMPEMDGIEATRNIRTHSTVVPIVALTAYAYESDKENALNAGCNDFLTKPISFAEIDFILERYMNS